MPTQPKPRTVVIFDNLPPLSRNELVEALTGIGPKHPAWRAMRQVMCDHLASWHQTSLAVQNAGTAVQDHACGAQAGIAEALGELDELMQAAVEQLEGEDEA